jgi:ribonuclease VapC
MSELSSFVLDSFALIGFFQQESHYLRIEKLLQEAKSGHASLFLSLVNWGEIYYSILRSKGESSAEQALIFIDELPIQIIEINRNLVYNAARLKSKYALSYADCFAAALAKEKDCPVLTGDPEFKKLHEEIKISWL